MIGFQRDERYGGGLLLPQVLVTCLARWFNTQRSRVRRGMLPSLIRAITQEELAVAILFEYRRSPRTAMPNVVPGAGWFSIFDSDVGYSASLRSAE